MYGEKEKSFLPRTFLIANHFISILIVFWLLFGGGIEFIGSLFGFDWVHGDHLRRILIFSCSLIYFVRIILTTFVLLKRKMDWSEVWTIVIWIYFIHTTFALLGGMQTSSVGLIEIVGIGFYLFGSYLNTSSEYLRKVWKQNPANKGKLYTKGLFRYSMHINYFGDVVLFTGFALVTHNLFSFIIPALMFILFTTINIPMLDKYLAEKYGKDFEEYSRKTKKFVPFIY
jgi:steroid 5-alpha reductase family enzyme